MVHEKESPSLYDPSGLIQMSIIYEVIMYNEHCPSESCSMGLYKTRELADAYIEKESPNYSGHMIFDIEEKYIRD